MLDVHQHCPCNGILLCRTCHGWVHAHPFDARANGWIVSRYRPPYEEQLNHAAHVGWVRLDCEGLWEFAHAYDEEHKYEE